MDYIKYPKNILQLSYQLKNLIDNYWEQSIREEEIVMKIKEWNNIYDILKYRKSLEKILGKKRFCIIEYIIHSFEIEKIKKKY